MLELLCGAVGFVLGIFYKEVVQAYFQREKYRHEKLMERYGELAASLAQDVQRLKFLRYALGSDPDNATVFEELEKERVQLLKDMGRLRFQIIFLETEADLVANLAKLLDDRSKVALPSVSYRSINGSKLLCSELVNYEKACNSFLSIIAIKHRNWTPLGQLPEQLPD